MSGGHRDYIGRRIGCPLDRIAEDGEVRARFPVLAQLIGELGTELRQIEHDLDWDLSSDSPIRDDAQFERAALQSLLEPVMKAAPDDLFTRGKWATIQDVQARAVEHRGLDPDSCD